MLQALKQPKNFYKTVFALMGPMVAQNILTQLLTLADTMMVGKLGESYLAATTMAATPLFVVMVLLMGIQSGASILIAQYWGKGDKNTINRVIGIGLYCSLGATILGAAAFCLFPMQILDLVQNSHELSVLGVSYLRIVSVSLIFNGVTSLFISAHRSMENPKLGFVILTGSAAFNVFGNWVLIFGKLGFRPMGIAGAATATLIARILELIAIVCYTAFNRRLPVKLKYMLRPGMVIVRDFFKYSLPVVLNEALWGVGAMLYPIILGHMDNSTSILAAYNISGNIERLFSVTVFAIGNASAVMIGKELGAGRRENVYNIGKALFALSILTGIVSTALMLLAYAFLLEPLFRLFDLSPDAQGSARVMILVLAAIVFIRNIGFNMGVGILRGGGDVRYTLIVDLATLYLIALPATGLSALVFKASIGIVYACIGLEDVFKTILVVARFRKKKWMNNLTREELSESA